VGVAWTVGENMLITICALGISSDYRVSMRCLCAGVCDLKSFMLSRDDNFSEHHGLIDNFDCARHEDDAGFVLGLRDSQANIQHGLKTKNDSKVTLCTEKAALAHDCPSKLAEVSAGMKRVLIMAVAGSA
jgi:hypothetical protein